MRKLFLILMLAVSSIASAETIHLAEEEQEWDFMMENGIVIQYDGSYTQLKFIQFKDMYARYFPVQSITISYMSKNFVITDLSDSYHDGDYKEMVDAILSGDAIMRVKRANLEQCSPVISGRAELYCAYNIIKNFERPYHIGIMQKGLIKAQ